MIVRVLPDIDLTEIEEVTGAATGSIRPIPTKEILKFRGDMLDLFLHKHALYSYPTTELLEYLSGIIAGKKAIEIGCGLGIIGRSLGIPITDSKQQSWPEVKTYYEAFGQPVIQYPDDVEELDALAAIEKYQPDVVIGSYITHIWDDNTKSGNYWGVDTLKLISSVDEYYMIGNGKVHLKDPAMPYVDAIEQHDFLVTRGDIDLAAIFRWNRTKKL